MRSYWIRVCGQRADGDLACEVGHRLPLADGSLDGIHAGWQWTGRDLVIQQDRYGFYPLFEWRPPGTRVVSTDLLTLVEHGAPTGLDFDALAVFVRVGFFVGADTPFRAIRAVLPPPLSSRRLDVSRASAVEGFIELFNAAIRRRLPADPFVMPLSGGRDSRHILFALRDAGCPPAACVTVRHFPPRANDDEAIAGELCAALGIEHRVLPQPRDRFALERRKTAATHLCTDEHAQFVVMADHLRTCTAVTYDGIAGDVLSQSTYLRPEVHALFERGDFEGVARYVLDGYGTMMEERALQRVLAPAVAREMTRERAVARLVEEIRRHAAAPNPTGAFFLANRTRREIALAPFALLRELTVFAPYLDRDLYDLLAGLPAPLLMDRTLHTEVIARAWPEHGRIPYERKGLTVQDRGAARALAARLAACVVRGRSWLRASALLPGLAAALADGNASRLWHASLLLYLDQVMRPVTAPSPTARER